MKGILLLSQGIDSPVAGYQMGRQGVELIALHFVTSADNPDSQIREVASVVRRLEDTLSARIRVYVIPHSGVLETLSTACRRNLTCVLCKRMMLRIAGRFAEENGASFIITGDSLGQVASQTLANMFAEEQATSVPVLRPLIGMDKVEITEISRQIRTYDISASSTAQCCYAPERPSTHSSVDEIHDEEERIDIESVTDGAQKRIREIDLSDVL